MKGICIRLLFLLLLTFVWSTRLHKLKAQSCTTCAEYCDAEATGMSCFSYTGFDCSWFGAYDSCRYPDTGACPAGSETDGHCCWKNHTPILVDVSGTGFFLSDSMRGVRFPIERSPRLFRVSWPTAESHNAWLVLDRNGNGRIDNGSELFGNYTEQAIPPTGISPNGFLALKVFDSPQKGGNEDGVISSDDAVYNRLRLWEDVNHDGLSTPGELFSLSAKDISGISLSYESSKRSDRFGNVFRYRAKVFRKGVASGRWAFDVYLKTSYVL